MLTVALIAALLVTLGMVSRTSSQRVSVASSQVGAAVKAGRVPQTFIVAGHDQQAPLQLDLASTPPSTNPDLRSAEVVAAPDQTAALLSRDVVAPIGRAPPVS